MTTRVSIKQVLACPVHALVLTSARDALNHGYFFRKEEIIQEHGLKALEDAIRWDHIVTILQTGADQEAGVRLIPVTSRFFKASAKARDATATLGQYVAGGAGRWTAGWVKATYSDGKLAVYKVNRMINERNGKDRAAKAFATEARDQLAVTGTGQGALPVLDAFANGQDVSNPFDPPPASPFALTD